MKRFLLLLFVALPALACATTVSTIDDITFWVGTGTNRTAMAIDWQGDNTTSESLMWGYRWDGTATAEDMLHDVLAADTRLYAKLTSFGGTGMSVIGLGYDASGDGEFALQDGADFDSSGIVVTGTSDFVPPVDGADYYVEGWDIAGFWHLSHNTAGVWNSSGAGIFVDTLVDGRWHGFAFSPSYSFAAFPTNLTAAQPPLLLGDFNTDGTVDALDYTLWRDGLGVEYTQADYAVWHDNFGKTANSTSFAIPEPATAWLVFSLLTMAWPAIGTRRV